jgi:hypothetical protein
MSNEGRYLLALVGQSNEADAGPASSRSIVGGLGAPYYRSTRGWWSPCSEAMARRGKWLSVANTAIGSTSLCDSWVGRCRTWSSGIKVGRGSYVLSGGGIWRCAMAAQTAGASTTAPTGTSDTTGADSVPWVYLGAPTTGDVDGAIYAYGSSRYDPNGYIAAAIAAIDGKPGYAARGIYVSIGQGDHTVGSTRMQYGQAMISVAQHVTGLGHYCWLGVTIGMSGPDAPTIADRDATMTGVIQAGRADALAALASNPLVKPGADLRAALGVPTATAIDTAPNSVNATDYLHATSATYDQAGTYVAASLASSGW